jgi:hypothetical protein
MLLVGNIHEVFSKKYPNIQDRLYGSWADHITSDPEIPETVNTRIIDELNHKDMSSFVL